MPAIDWAGLFGGVQAQALEAIQAVLPLAVTIFGAILAVRIGVKIFNRLAGR